MTQDSARDARALLATCVAAAVRSAEVVRAGAERVAQLEWSTKAPSDFVTDVDRDSERALGAVIVERHPDAVLVAEELSPELRDAPLTFVADPLDGTTNFLHGVPWYAVSIAALVHGAHAASVVLNVATGELFTATAGGGARRNGQPIHVSTNTDPARALVGTGFPFTHREGIEPYLKTFPAIMAGTAGIRRIGAAALDLCDVACGRFDAFWELRLAPWDMAAGTHIIREAGGIVTDLEGRPSRVAAGPLVAGSPPMHAWLLRQVSG